MPTREKLVEVLGYSIRVGGTAVSGQKARGRQAQVLSVIFVKDPKRYFTSARMTIRGTTFVLDCDSRTLYLKPTRSYRVWTRTVLFALGLVAEHQGPEAVACHRARGLAPLPLHTSAVAIRDGALVFCGHSTFGKTTIATKLLRGRRLINEDLNILFVGPFSGRRKPEARVFVEHGAAGARHRSNRGALNAWTLPVRGLFWLKKGPSFAIQPMPAATSVANLLQPIFGKQRPENARHRMSMLRALLRVLPCQTLEFRKERGPLLRLLRAAGYL